MTSVIKINGKAVFCSKDYRPDFNRAMDSRAGAVNSRPDGLPSDGTPISPRSPHSLYRAGVPYYDEHEDVVYRVVVSLNITEGWGTAEFWTKRWGCYYTDLLKVVRQGMLDAAIEQGSAVKRFRCRDEWRAQEYLEKLAEAAPKSRIIKKRIIRRKVPK